jgi:DNA-binding MarR family transcriptional regulator
METNFTRPTTLPELLFAVIKACHGSEAVEYFPDIKFSQLRALMVVWHRGPISISHLAAALSTSVSSASKSADALVGLGHVARSESTTDRRAKQLVITESGRALIERFIEGRTEAISQRLAGYPHQAELSEALSHLYTYLTESYES